MRFLTYCASVICFALASAPAIAAAAENYILGPGDHLQIRISDFRSGTGEAYQWPMFAQPMEEFIVAPDGSLSVPMLGVIGAAGRTTQDLESEIATRLQNRAGLTTRPDASVQIVKFRPIYVAGAVDKPGEYDYRPGLTVLQAVSIAGGLERVTADLLLGMEKDALTARGDLRVLAADRVSLLARQARIDAETQGHEAIVFPAELTASGDAEAARAVREETLLFDAQRDGLNRQTEALKKNKAFLTAEIERLHAKIDTIASGLSATRREYELIAGLVKRGLSAAPRQLELEQNLAQYQGNQLDVEVAIVRANEDIERADRDLADLESKFRNDLVAEAQDVRVKLNETNEKIETDRQLVQQSEVHAPAQLRATLDAGARPAFSISRVDGEGKTDEEPARESDRVKPGDVVRVILSADPALGSQAPGDSAGARN